MRSGSWLPLLLLFSAAATTALAECPPPEDHPFGALPGTFEVDLTGSATYRMPFALVPGTAGVEPALTLTYDSGATDGPLGLGWSITGLSRITRVGRTLAQDGVPGAVGYTDDDRYALDGARLMLIEGTRHHDGARYRTEIESWQDVQGVGRAGSGQASFIVRTPDGSVHTYGASDATRIRARGQDAVRVWAIDRTTTPFGNTLQYQYAADATTGTLRVTRIDYTGNDAAGLKARRSVRFGYLSRPDPRRRWVGGAPVDRVRLLTEVEAWLDDTLVRRYTLAYGQGDATRRSLLTSVTECDGAGRCLPATTFDYLDLDRGRIDDAKAGEKAHDVAHDGAGQWFVDVNGDGRADHVYERDDSSEYRVRLATAGGFAEDASAGEKTHDVAHGGASQWFVDVDGDGRADHVYEEEGSSTYRVRLSTGARFASDADWGARAHGIAHSGEAQWFVDLDGDGRADHVYRRDGDDAYRVRLSTGAKFAEDADWGSVAHTVAHAPDAQWFVDVDGDGLPDHVYERDDSSEYRVRLNLGGRFGDDTKWGEKADDVANGGQSQWLVDVNGDALADVVYQSEGDKAIRVLLSTGAGFAAEARWGSRKDGASDPHQWLIDVNGDGLPEFVYKRNDASTFGALQNVDSGFGIEWDFARKSEHIAHDGASIWPVDVDGNGLIDLVYEQDDTSTYRVMVVPGLPADRLVRVTNGLGRVDAVRYAPMAQEGYTPDPPGRRTIAEPSGVPGAAQAVQGGARLLAVEYHLKNDPARNPSTFDYRYTYAYAGAVQAFDGRGDQGFRQVTQTDHQLGASTVTTLDTAFPRTGSVTQIHRVGVAGGVDPRVTPGMLLDLRTMAWGVTSPTDPHVFLVRMSDQRHDVYDYGTYHHSTSRLSTHDAFGNQVLLSQLGYVSRSGANRTPDDDVYVQSTFESATGDRWYIGVPTGTRRCADQACTRLLRETRLEVDLATLAATSSAAWIDDDGAGQSGWRTTRYAHDAVGNRSRTVDPAGVATQTVYDADLQTFPTTITRSAGALTQTVTQAFDPATGAQRRQVDLNGQVTARCVAPLGLVQLECGPAQPGQAADRDCAWAGAAVVLSRHASASTGTVTTQRADWAGTAWRETRVILDALGRTTQTRVGSSADDRAIVTDHAWLTAQLMLSTTLPRWEGEAPVAVLRGYDVFGRTTEVLQPFAGSGSPTRSTWTYAPEAVTAVSAAATPDALTTITRTAFVGDEQRVIARVDPDGGETTFSLDRLGRVVAIRDPSGGTRTSSFNAVDQILVGASPEAGTVRFTYDAAGRISSQTDALKQQTTTGYDALGRVIDRTRHAADGTIYERVETGYDVGGLGGTVGRIATSRLTREGAPVLDYAYGYDPHGAQTARRITLADGTVAQTETRLDPAGRPLGVTLPGGWAATLEYDPLGFTAAASLRDPSGAAKLSATFSAFDATGRPGRIAYGNGAIATFGYDSTRQPAARTLTAADGGALEDLTYSWSRTGHLEAIADRRPAAGRIGPDLSQRFEHAAGRLTAATGAYGARSYAYAQGGNLTRKDGVDYTYAGQQVVSGAADGAAVFAAKYDANGNQIERQAGAARLALRYDPANRLTVVTRDGALLGRYTYDHATRRIGATAADGTLTRTLAPGYELVGDTTIWSLLVDGARIGQIRQRDATQTALYFHQDLVNSTVTATDAKGALAARRITGPFGEVIAPASEAPDRIEHGFDDKRLDPSGLMFFGARYYDPLTGRFVTADTQLGGRLGQQDSQNRYAFALGDPTRWGDPTGHGVFSWMNHHVVHPVEHAARTAGHAIAHDATASAHFVLEHHEALMIGLAVGLTAASVASIVLDVATAGATVEITAGLAEADEEVIGATIAEEAAEGAADGTAEGGDAAADGVDSASSDRGLRPDGDGSATNGPDGSADSAADAEGQARGRFRCIDKADGGRLYVSDGPIDATDVADVAQPELDRGEGVDVFTNVHGAPDGTITGEPQNSWNPTEGNRFMYQDRELSAGENWAEVIDMTKAHEAAYLPESLASDRITILAWCYSDAFPQVASYLPAASAAP